MKTFLLRRSLQAIAIVFGVTLVTFFLLHMTGDPVGMLLPADASREGGTPTASGSDGRVRAVLQPKAKEKPVAQPPVPLKSEAGISAPRDPTQLPQR